MKILNMRNIFLVIFLVLITGCGHNRFNEYKAWGPYVSIPLGDMGCFTVGIGSMETTTALVRGGSSFNTQTIAGEGLLAGAGGTAKITTFKSNEQLNEGNIVDVMTSPDVPAETKTKIANNLTTTAPDFDPSAMLIREAALYSNGFTNELRHPFKSTGVDKLADVVDDVTKKIADDATDVAKDIIDSTKDTVNTISDHLNPGKKIKDTIETASYNISKTVARILMIVVILAILIVVALLFRRKRIHHIPVNKKCEEPPEFVEEEPPVDSDFRQPEV